MEVIISHSPEETHLAGENLAKSLKSGDVVALEGDLGSGKTVLTRGICQGLGYKSRVSSPSFVRINTYPHQPMIYHVDLYLVRSEDEAMDLGLEDIFDSESIVIIEWAQRFPDLVPISCKHIKLEWTDNNETTRRITVY